MSSQSVACTSFSHCAIINLVLFCLTGLRENRRHPATYLVHGAKALNNAFRTWTRKEVKPYLLLFTFHTVSRMNGLYLVDLFEFACIASVLKALRRSVLLSWLLG